jgi:hypothetical protein
MGSRSTLYFGPAESPAPMPETDIFDSLLGVSRLRDQHLRQSRPLASWQAVPVRLVYENQTVAPEAAAEFLTRLQYHLENPVPLTSTQPLPRKDLMQYIID